MREFRAIGVLSLCCWAWASCAGPTPDRLNAPPQGASVEQPGAHEFFDYQNDQGMMEDLSISDVHFIPHTAILNGTGTARLLRYRELFGSRGGALTYDTQIQDEKLINDRIAAAEKLLYDADPECPRIEVAVGLPGGPGMEGPEAVQRRKEIQARNYDSESFSAKREQDSFSFGGSGS